MKAPLAIFMWKGFKRMGELKANLSEALAHASSRPSVHKTIAMSRQQLPRRMRASDHEAVDLKPSRSSSACETPCNPL